MQPAEPHTFVSRLAALAFLATAVLAFFLLVRFRQVELAVHLYLVVMATAIAATVAERALREVRYRPEAPSLLDRWRARQRPSRPERVRQLEELEHAVDFSLTTAFDVHYRLRPHLVRIAAHRLAVRRGIQLDAEPQAARAVLGDAAWAVVRPDRQAPDNRNAPGIDLGSLRAVIGGLESI